MFCLFLLNIFLKIGVGMCCNSSSFSLRRPKFLLKIKANLIPKLLSFYSPHPSSPLCEPNSPFSSLARATTITTSHQKTTADHPHCRAMNDATYLEVITRCRWPWLKTQHGVRRLVDARIRQRSQLNVCQQFAIFGHFLVVVRSLFQWF